MQDLLLLDLPDPFPHIQVPDRYLVVGNPLCSSQSGGCQAAGSCLWYSYSIQGSRDPVRPSPGMVGGGHGGGEGLGYDSVWGGHDGGHCALCDSEQEVKGKERVSGVMKIIYSMPAAVQPAEKPHDLNHGHPARHASTLASLKSSPTGVSPALHYRKVFSDKKLCSVLETVE